MSDVGMGDFVRIIEKGVKNEKRIEFKKNEGNRKSKDGGRLLVGGVRR